MRKYLVALLAVAAACSNEVPPGTPPPLIGVANPDVSYSLESQARALLNCSSGTVSYSVDETGGGTVAANGIYTAPACAVVTYPVTYHVTVSGCGNTNKISIAVDEAFTSIKIVCAIPQGTSTCLDPAQPLTIPPSSTVQFYAKTAFTCHNGWSPGPIPAGACTAAFCQ